MPSPNLPLPLSPQPHHHHHHHNHNQTLIAPLAAAGISFSLLILIAFLYRKLTLSRTSPLPENSPSHLTPQISPDKKHLRRFHFSHLKKSTANFSDSNRLGQGGFGSVYRADFQKTGEVFAVKVMDASASGSIQGEREFHNEIALAYRVNSTSTLGFYPHLVNVVGYSIYEEKKILVYEYVSNGSLQEKLIDNKCVELCVWQKRFNVIVHVAKALRFLHFNCGDTSVVHGDVKPSNVLLDDDFNAKLGDFGLAQILDEKNDDVRVLIEVNDDNNNNCSKDVEIVSVSSIVEESSLGESMSVESVKKKNLGSSCRDYWWWKQGGEDCSSGRVVKDYVMEWIGSEIKKEIPKSCNVINCNDVVVVVDDNDNNKAKVELKKKKKKRLEWWWGSLDEEDKLRKKGRKPREWWREEFCEELSKKNKKSKAKAKAKTKSSVGTEMWWQRDEEFVAPERKKRKKSKTSFGSIDWWLDGLSGEIRNVGNCRRNSQDFGVNDVPKSGGISSTPSMRGTVCYIAPEYGGGGQLSDKCDVYSFGVLVLVVISGRRPLQVLASPMSEFERANLVSWARQLAYNGKLLDLVDTSIQLLDKEQAMLCITIALLCLQRSPCKRPNMKEIVEMLTGEVDPPHLPFEFSPSPPSGFPFKSRKKGRMAHQRVICCCGPVIHETMSMKVTEYGI